MNKLLFQINENKLLVQCKKRLKTDQKSFFIKFYLAYPPVPVL